MAHQGCVTGIPNHLMTLRARSLLKGVERDRDRRRIASFSRQRVSRGSLGIVLTAL